MFGPANGIDQPGRESHAMKNLIVIVTVLVLAGCGGTYQMGRQSPDLQAQKAFDRLGYTSVVLTLHDGSKFDGYIDSVTKDTLRFEWSEHDVLGDPGPAFFVTADQVRSLSGYPEKTVCVILGGLLGAGLGGLAGWSTTGGHEGLDGIPAVLGGAFVGAATGACIGFVAAPATNLTFSPMASKHARMASMQTVAIEANEISEEGGSVEFVYSDKIIALPKAEVEVERSGNVFVIHATKRTLRLRPLDSPLEYPGSSRDLAIIVPAISVTDSRFVSFTIAGKTIRLLKRQVKLENTTNGIRIQASPETFRVAGLNIV